MTLAHDVTGDGPAVLLLHSTAADRRMWDAQVPALAAAGHRVVRPDFRGYGETPAPSRSWNDADDVVGLLDERGVAVAAVVGASGGGKVALELAARWPQRVRRLVLLCTATADFEPGPELRAFGAEEDVLLEAGDVAAATELNVRTWLGPEATEAVRDKLREMQRHAFEVQLAAPEVAPVRVAVDLAAITAPALLVSGAYDLPDFRRIAVDLAARLPEGRHLELDRAGHLPAMERPGEVSELLIDLL
ncbi:alpha/beta fold hydrolase [Symbioplanes lichenis]|uniref:alpha/beta fold hydrolase n=1 Tax=Symbioplanes lichenis TaxID=1629072 RepID=UPI002739F2FD|nr:alpha/beta hydrolase [Actinoplanes lichenis]